MHARTAARIRRRSVGPAHATSRVVLIRVVHPDNATALHITTCELIAITWRHITISAIEAHRGRARCRIDALVLRLWISVVDTASLHQERPRRNTEVSWNWNCFRTIECAILANFRDVPTGHVVFKLRRCRFVAISTTLIKLPEKWTGLWSGCGCRQVGELDAKVARRVETRVFRIVGDAIAIDRQQRIFHALLQRVAQSITHFGI